MAKIPTFDEDTGRRLFEVTHGTEKEKAAALAQFYGIESISSDFETGAYRSCGDIVLFIGGIAEEMQRNSLAQLIEANYNDIEFEPKSPRGNNNQKLLFTYDKSLERIKAAGKERHARPSEVFSFLIANLENKLTPAQKAIADDMLDSYGEWLNMAWQRKRDKIILYSDPENLKWDGGKYAVDGGKLICSNENEFPLARDIPALKWIDLKTFDDGLVQFLYSRQFLQLPKEMREGDKMAQLYLPPENMLWPLGRGFDYSVYGYYYFNWVSRWVAPSQNFSTGNEGI